MDKRFQWTEFYMELASALLHYKNNRSELICNLLYKIGLDDKDKKLLFKTFRKNKKMLAAMNIKKKEFSTDIMDAVEEALSYNYELQSLNAKR